MKNLYIFFLFILTTGFAQIPSDYYDSASGLSGFTLKTELKNITTTGHFWNASTGYDDLYTAYVNTHSDVMTSSGNQYENDGTVLDFYSENPTASGSNNDPYNYSHGSMQCGNQMAEGDCYNREHLVPQSSFSSAFPMQADIHHVIPTDGRVNNFRGSLPFGEALNDDFMSMNGSIRGSSDMIGYSGSVFEPIDEFKGDIARALLYFVTRYEDSVDQYTSFDMFNGTNDQVFPTWAIDVLLDWHNNVDPVDQRELDRNEAAYTFQGNANPFVDHPEYANLIWNPGAGDTEAPSTPTNLMASNPTTSTVDLTWTASTDNIGVLAYDVYVDTNFYVSTNSNTTLYTVTGLSPETTYSFTVLARDAANNMSGQSVSDSETTLAGPGGGVDLFISEYVEGSSNNKAIEIANFTGGIVDLTDYSLARDVNSNGSWGASYQLTGSVMDGDVNVIVKSNASPTLLAYADQTTSADALVFNGDDPVGLFKDGILIDVFGNFGGSNSFSNVTYRRKSIVTQPTTTFNLNDEWLMYAFDTFDGLGSHSQTLGDNDFVSERISFYPNPVSGHTIHFNNRSALTVTIYDVLGKKVLIARFDRPYHGLDISSLKKGIYILKINSPTGTVTKKLIRQ